MKKIKKILGWHWDLIKQGIAIDYFILMRGSPKVLSGQVKILKAANRIFSKSTQNSVAYVMAFECVADVHMRQHKFEEAAEEFEKAIVLNAENGIPFDKLGYLYESLAACYYNCGHRKKAVTVISEAIANKVDPNIFSHFLDDKKLKTLITELNKSGKVDQGNCCESN